MFTMLQFLTANGKESDYYNWRRRAKWHEALLAQGYVRRDLVREGDYAIRKWYGKPEEFASGPVSADAVSGMTIPDTKRFDEGLG